MKAPCQVVYWYLLPAMSSALSRELVKLGMPQKKIALALGLTPAAVSQYLSRKRGKGIKLDKKTRAEITKLAKKIARKKMDECDVMYEVCGICAIARRSRSLCKMHKEMTNPRECYICMDTRSARRR
ncbi:MAG: transcriptional regulator [Candidatus Micrarchaeota archaeon]